MWFPNQQRIDESNLSAMITQLHLQHYWDLYHWSIQNRSDFWAMMLQHLNIRFRQPYSQILDLSDGVEVPHWCCQSTLNIIDSCFKADPNAIAILSQKPGTPIKQWTYGDLQRMTYQVANSLVKLNYHPGDAIAIDLPMTPEAIAIYLGIIAAGCIAVSIADSFAAEEIAIRLRLSSAKAIFTQDRFIRGNKCLPLYEKVIQAHAPQAIVLETQSPSSDLRVGDLSWTEFLMRNDPFTPIARKPDATINILFSSGTTGDPKAIPWTQTTPIKCATDGYLHHDLHPGDIAAWPTNLGWMMGPWLVFASLINKAAIALYEDSPTERGFGEFIQKAGVTHLGVVPSLVRSWKQTDCMRELDWSRIKVLSSTGECSNPEDMLYLSALAGYKPIIEYCGGTEIGGGYLTSTVIQPNAPATFTTPALGLELVILDDQGLPSPKGEVFLVPPSIGLSTQLLNRDHHQVYFAESPKLAISNNSKTLRGHGDQLKQLASGRYRVLGRVDDTMNLGGIKVSSAELEEVCNALTEIQETAAIAISPPTGGPAQLIIYAVLNPKDSILASRSKLLITLQTQLKTQLNPLFKIHDLVIVDALPRTASNKVMRRRLRDPYQASH